VVQALNLLAVLNPNIQHVAIDGALFQEEVNDRKIMSVPSIYLNGELFGQGRMNLEEILAKIDTSAGDRQAEKTQRQRSFRCAGGRWWPSRFRAAIYAARKGIRTGVAAERFGGQVLDTMAIENFISVQHTEGPKLAVALEEHVKQYEVDIMNLQRGRQLIPGKDGELHQVRFASGASLKGQDRDSGDRRALARNERAGRAAIPQQGRSVLPALRWSAVQGQACLGDRRWQLRR
jgi:alkyl hydroperoxide reductase subunit F